jgi:hypothetical protein
LLHDGGPHGDHKERCCILIRARFAPQKIVKYKQNVGLSSVKIFR